MEQLKEEYARVGDQLESEQSRIMQARPRAANICTSGRLRNTQRSWQLVPAQLHACTPACLALSKCT